MMVHKIDYAQKMQYVEALKEEQKKIQVFQRELPLCLELVTQAIEACKKELSNTSTTSEQCSEQTASVCGGPVFEEFIPIKKSINNEEENGEHESPREIEKSDVDSKKSDWLRSAHLWNHSPDPDTTTVVVVAKKAKVVEVKPNSNSNRGGFQPFIKEKKRVLSESDVQPAVKATTLAPAPAPATTTSSTTEVGGADKAGEEKIQKQQTQSQSPTHRKQRRCWSPELHRRFLHALQQLGGSHVATPKQIRDHMKVDGLTNDEVKSHLQKYRLHTRRPATSVLSQSNGNSQQPQYVVVGGIWVPSSQEYPPPSDVANKGDGGVYAPVTALLPQSPKHSVERSSGRCSNSPSASSSTNTTTTSSASPVS